MKVLEKARGGIELSPDDILDMLRITDADELRELFSIADKVRREQVGNKVYLRGLIEISNICTKNCLYCGIRRDAVNVSRYTMTFEQVLDCVEKARSLGMSSLVIQSGERSDEKFISLPFLH
ncbi:MAG TPA: hypothetical protein PK821_02240 [Victivallales bacterium]|nr:hypothetical protein [Victivallales bacterium]